MDQIEYLLAQRSQLDAEKVKRSTKLAELQEQVVKAKTYALTVERDLTRQV